MDNDKMKKNEELQSRRDFFKKAAKGILPILGTVILSSLPSIAKCEKDPSGCNWACEGLCSGNCYGSCAYRCSGCSGTCTGTCSGTCSGSCSGSCSYYCSYSTRMGG